MEKVTQIASAEMPEAYKKLEGDFNASVIWRSALQ